MDDVTAISIAKTDFRDAYNNADVDALLELFADGFTDFTDGGPSFFGAEARVSLRQRTLQMFQQYRVEFAPIIIDVVVQGSTAYDYGWHKTWLHPKDGGPVTFRKERYFETWQRQSDGKWKLTLLMTNKECPPAMLPS